MLNLSRTTAAVILIATAVVAFCCWGIVIRSAREQTGPVVFGKVASVHSPQPPPQPSIEPPEKVVDRLWKMATAGEWFNEDGRRRISGLFTSAPPVREEFSVVSNNWGSASCIRTDGKTAEVEVGYWPLGKIDKNLRFIPDPDSKTYTKYFQLFHLTNVPTYTMVYESGGEDLILKGKKPTGDWAWQIDHEVRPFATVNTAIRYAMEESGKSTDPEKKRNADQTVRKLLMYD